MFDQSFSLSNFETIFNLELRKGRIDFNGMPQDYKDVVANIRWTRSAMATQRRKKLATWTEDEKKDYKNNGGLLKHYQEQKDGIVKQVLGLLATRVNSTAFRFGITSYMYGAKECFTIDVADWAQFYAMKTLQQNVVKAFNVEMLNRHTVMQNLKLQMNTNLPIYIIRTDVSSFFESIKHDRLFALIDRNSVLSVKSKEMTKNIIREYDRVKNTTLVPKGQGVPRGIGISSPLSEIYMADIDKEIKGRKEVIFYSRYVDDILIILAYLPQQTNLNKYYQELVSKFRDEYGLTLQPVGSAKCELHDLYKHILGTPRNQTLSYLGYKLYVGGTDDRKVLFGLSDDRKTRFKGRVDHAFVRFGHVVKVDIKQAKRDLRDAINLITGNIRLSKAKSGVKVGFYYNNDLLDKDADFQELEDYLKRKVLPIPANLFTDTADRMAFESKIRTWINSISLRERWKERLTFDINYERLREIERWL